MAEPDRVKKLSDGELTDKVIILLCELKIRHKMGLLQKRIEELQQGTDVIKSILRE